MTTFAVGSILIFSDWRDNVQGDAVVLSALDGSTIGTIATPGTLPYASLGDRVISGIFAVTVEDSGVGNPITSINVYASDTTLIASNTDITVSTGMSPLSPLSSNQSDKFYVAGRHQTGSDPVVVYTIDTAGVLGSMTWTLPSTAATVQVIAPNASDTILYWGAALGVTNHAIHRWDLVNDVALTDLVNLDSHDEFAHSMFVMANGDILCLFAFDNSDDAEVRRYGTDGTLKMTYPLVTNAVLGDTPEMWRDANPSVFWTRAFPLANKHTSLFTQWGIGSTTPLLSFTVTNLDGGGDAPTTCPLISLGIPVSPIPPADQGPDDPIRRLRRAPHLWDGANGHRLTYPGFQLLVESGAPRDTNAPLTFFLQWSDDGGHKWSNLHELAGSNIGQYKYRFWWRRLGQSRDRVFQVINSDSAKIVLIDALLTPDPVEGSS